MSLYLKAKLPFENKIMFKEFLPETKDKGIHFSLQEGNYQIIIYLSDRKSQLKNISSIPCDPEELKRYENLFCGSLTMEIEMLNPDSNIIKALENNQPNEETERLGQEIMNIILETHRGIVNYFRDIAEQYWVDHLTVDPRNYQNLLDFTFEVKWFSSTDEWKRFSIVRKNISYASITLFKNGVNQEMWDEISSFISNNHGKAPMIKTLISDSYQLLAQNNGRLAIIEAVTALEHSIKIFLPMILPMLSDSRLTIDKRLLDKLMHKAGLSLLIKWALKLIQPSISISDDDIQICLDAIGVRRNIVHGAMREIGIIEARKFVSTIRRVIKILEEFCCSSS